MWRILPKLCTFEIREKSLVLKEILNLLSRSPDKDSKLQKYKMILSYTCSFQEILTILNEYDFYVHYFN